MLRMYPCCLIWGLEIWKASLGYNVVELLWVVYDYV